ncbi:MAG: bifunctional phosphoglucose/phosphomannose isomerase [Candidatus Omnitrophica bacterium]|nr:bifunctional phosphoglucose/phosphomannose isomerase [Candidatus Omnitrophota bacterium]
MKCSKKLILKYDKNDMLSLLKDFPKHCSNGYNFKIPSIKKNFKKVIFTGMGGSAISGDIIKTIIEETGNIPVFCIRDYSLPSFVDNESLVVVESYSGNTEETVNIYKLSRKKSSIMLCVSSNGEIEKMCKNDGIPLIKIPSGMPPRCALGYLLLPVYKFFVNLKILPELENKFFEKLKKWVDEFLPEKESNLAIQIAENFYKKVPIIYSENRFYPGILRWKTQIAENSKSFSFINVLPEMNHNEIMSFNFPKWFIKNIVVLFIISDMENERVRKRIEITEKIISNKINQVLKIKLKGDTLFEKLLYLIILGDWVSFYLGILNKVNPTEIKEINILKEELQKGGR